MKNRKRQLFLFGLLLLALAGTVYYKRGELFLPLHKRLVSSHDEIRNLAYIKLGKLSEDTKAPLVTDLLLHTQSQDENERRYALYALRKINIIDEGVKSAIHTGFHDSSEAVRKEAMASALNAGPTYFPQILKSFSNLNADLKSEFVTGVQRFGADAVAPLVETLDKEKPPARSEAAFLLWKLGRDSTQAYPTLITHLKDPDRQTRIYSALAVNVIRSSETKTLNVYKELLADPNWEAPHYAALEALSKMGKKAKSLVPLLEKASLKAADGFEQESYQRPAIARALGQINPRATNFKGLEWDLKNKSPLVRYRAALFIGDEEKPSVIFLPMLIKALDDTDDFVFARAVYGLGKIGIKESKRYHASLVQKILLSNKRMEKVKGYEAMAMPVLAQLETELIPHVVMLLQSKTISLPVADVSLSYSGSDALASLKPYLEYTNSDVRLWAALVLGKKGMMDDKVKRELDKATKSANPWVAARANEILSNLKV